MSKMSEMDIFVDEVDTKVESEYGFQDGGDLCFNMIESGEIDITKHSVSEAARMVAQRIGQA